MPPKPASKPQPANPKGKGRGKSKGKGKHKQKRHKLNLKGWLKTAADWARFNAWAKINALPRKIPEPEPIVRQSKPLSQLKKRLLVISKPSKKFNDEEICRLGLSVSKAALKAKPSKRIKELAKFVWKEGEPCKESPNPITKAALKYKPSARIIEIALPHIHPIESCHVLEISKNALRHKTTEREKQISLAKKVRDCPSSLTDEEIMRLLTPTGIRKSALVYKITDWVSILALPSYRFLKDRRDPDAKEMKKQLEESEDRGKKVLEEQRKKEEEKKKKVEKRKKKKKKKKEKPSQASGEEEDEKKSEGGEEKGEKESEEGQEQGERESEEGQEQGERESEEGQKQGAKKSEEGQEQGEKRSEEDEKKAEEEEKRKRKERQKWRKEPGPCKTNLGISKAALNAKASERTEEMAKPHIHESNACTPKFAITECGVRKSALNGSASARVTEMAKPNHPSDPVERPPPREKDANGVPIFPMPVYGKQLPEVKPYKMGECKSKDEAKMEPEKRKKVYKVPLFPSIDPCLDPIGAKRQAKAREAAEEARKAKMEEKKQGNGDHNENDNSSESSPSGQTGTVETTE